MSSLFALHVAPPRVGKRFAEGLTLIISARLCQTVLNCPLQPSLMLFKASYFPEGEEPPLPKNRPCRSVNNERLLVGQKGTYPSRQSNNHSAETRLKNNLRYLSEVCLVGRMLVYTSAWITLTQWRVQHGLFAVRKSICSDQYLQKNRFVFPILILYNTHLNYPLYLNNNISQLQVGSHRTRS